MTLYRYLKVDFHYPVCLFVESYEFRLIDGLDRLLSFNFSTNKKIKSNQLQNLI